MVVTELFYYTALILSVNSLNSEEEKITKIEDY